MNESDDIGNLYRRIGGDPGGYYEIAREDEARQARQRWPLLRALSAASIDIPAADGAHVDDAASTQATVDGGRFGRNGEREHALADRQGLDPRGEKGLRGLFARGLRPPSTPAPETAAPIEAASRFGVVQIERSISPGEPSRAAPPPAEAAAQAPSRQTASVADAVRAPRESADDKKPLGPSHATQRELVAVPAVQGKTPVSDQPNTVLRRLFERAEPAVERNELRALFSRISDAKRAVPQEPGAGS